MPAALLDRLQTMFADLNLWQGYGMTECSSVLTFLTPEDHRRGGAILRSAGRPALGIEISIQDAHDKVLGPNEDGEVCARGGNFMQEYWHRPEQTEAVFRDGWYRTGDLGHRDEAGYVYLVDRSNDMIVTGGENVYSIEVENAISTHPGVAQVAVIGIPHEVWGEQVHAIVVLDPDAQVSEDDIRDHAAAQHRGLQGAEVGGVPHRPHSPVSGAQTAQARATRAVLGRPFDRHSLTARESAARRRPRR